MGDRWSRSSRELQQYFRLQQMPRPTRREDYRRSSPSCGLASPCCHEGSNRISLRPGDQFLTLRKISAVYETSLAAFFLLVRYHRIANVQMARYGVTNK